MQLHPEFSFNLITMKKKDFYSRMSEELELGNNKVNENTPIHLSSLQTLVLIMLIDENFEKQIKITDLKEVETISDLMTLIGTENFTD